MVMEGVQEDMGEGNMQYCTDHPYKNTTPGGICAFCLQEKLGKLVSSSFPIVVFPSSSSSSSPSSFRSDFGVGVGVGGSSSAAIPARPNSSSSSIDQNGRNNKNDCHHHHQYYSRRARIPFLLTQKKKKKKDIMIPTSSADHHPTTTSIVFKRSKSTATPRHGGGGGGVHFLDADDEHSPHKRGFWSFLYLSKPPKNTTYGTGSGSLSQRSRVKKKEEFVVVVEENESPNQASSDRKVSRSRSVGCGSRSFSGDFFERISTGFGDCTLRRVESQREGKPKVTAVHRGQDCVKERVKCGGIFSGFLITSSSSSSSSSSYWVSSSTEDNMNGKAVSAPAPAGHLAHGRSKSWGWAFASPIRAFSKPSSGKREASNKNTTPNLAAIPSLLAVRG
uniref:Uncharacterized protein n=1 Tax=Davidia involucrata TaxID=16924 RepID=A0A5B6YI72_DAVIN